MKRNRNNKISQTIGFLGSGHMAQAVIEGLISTKLISPRNLWASNRSPKKLQALKRRLKIQTVKKNQELADKAKVILLAVKPQDAAKAARSIPLTNKHLLISMAAGLTLNRLRELFGSEPRIIRVMPNTPCFIQSGASGIYGGDTAKKKDLALTSRIFSAVGKVYLVSHEDKMAAITALSGSGPAYVFLFLEALAQGGVEIGIDAEAAYSLALQTVLGSAKLLEATQNSPAELRKMVTSTGGTTERGLAELSKQGFSQAIEKALRAAYERSKEMSKEM